MDWGSTEAVSDGSDLSVWSLAWQPDPLGLRGVPGGGRAQQGPHQVRGSRSGRKHVPLLMSPAEPQFWLPNLRLAPDPCPVTIAPPPLTTTLSSLSRHYAEVRTSKRAKSQTWGEL